MCEQVWCGRLSHRSLRGVTPPFLTSILEPYYGTDLCLSEAGPQWRTRIVSVGNKNHNR